MKKTPIILALLLAVGGSAIAVDAIAQTNPIPGIGVVVKKNPGGGAIAVHPTGLGGSFEIKDLPMGNYSVFVGTCAPIIVDMVQVNNVLSGDVTRDGKFMMIRMHKPLVIYKEIELKRMHSDITINKEIDHKQDYSNATATQSVTRCPIDDKVKGTGPLNIPFKGIGSVRNKGF